MPTSLLAYQAFSKDFQGNATLASVIFENWKAHQMNKVEPLITNYEDSIWVLREKLVEQMNDRSFDGTEPSIVREEIVNLHREKANSLLALITLEFYENSLEAYKKEMEWHQGKVVNQFPTVLLHDAIAELMSVALVYAPKMIGRDDTFDKMKFYIETHWEDELTLNDWL